MRQLTSAGQALVTRLAQQYAFSEGGVRAMLDAIVAGNGSMAQFDHADLGGPGQWMRGGMLMIGSPFDHDLKSRVERLGEELARHVEREPGLVEHGGSFQRQSQSDGTSGAAHQSARASSWWPTELGRPDSSGAQNDTRYAYFAGPRRLAIESRGRVRVYDTGEHRFGGFSQQQGAGESVTFASQHGTVALDSLAEVTRAAAREAPLDPGDPIAAIERLAALHARGILSDAEFAGKKAQLLERI